MRIMRVLSLAVFAGLVAVTAAAQERGKVGVTMGYPASVGILWHATDTVAIRPEVNFTGTSSESSDSDSWTIATGISALFYLREVDNVHTYFSPRLTYQRSSVTGPTFGGEDVTRTLNAWGLVGSFGAQYSPNARFGVFGEVGFGFSRANSGDTSFGTGTASTAWGTRAGVGVVFYPGS